MTDMGQKRGRKPLAALVVLALFPVPLLLPAQVARLPGPSPTAVYILADHHTTRWTGERDPLVKIAGVCQIAAAQATYTLTCSAPPASEPRTGRRHFYTVALFRDLEETLYLAACSATTRESRCGDLRAGQTFPAEVEDRTIRVVARGEQLPLRILEMRPRPAPIDSPPRGTPSQVRAPRGTPSDVPYSQVAPSGGVPSQVRPSEVSEAAGAPSVEPPSEGSPAVASPTSARLYLQCAVGSARVYVDDQLVGRPPLEIPLLPGRHTVVVRAQGFRVWTRTVYIPAGSTTRLTAELRR